MENKSNIIEYFEAMLQKKCTNEKSALYKGTKKTEKLLGRTQDVIDIVNIQIKAMQVADSVKSGKLSNINYKKSNFLTVDDLPSGEEEIKQQLNNKFETQCVSDTQLIEVVKTVEILDIKKGITQEFNNTFYCTILDKGICDSKNVSHNVKNVSHIEIDNIGIVTQLSSEMKKTCQTEMKDLELNRYSPDVFIENNGKCMELQSERHKSNSVLNVKKTNHIPEDLNTEKSFNEDNQINDKEIVSPILNKKIVKPPKSPSPLIFDLDVFEKFESTAFPKIIKDTESSCTKHLINSQQNSTKGHRTEKKDETELHSSSLNAEEGQPTVVKLKIPIQKRNVELNNSLQDEILFSSDEEENYIHKQSQDLPFTCALETSFYDQSDILDRTMYVGFQTASNKSIQVCSDSFSKAKVIFDEIDNKCNIKELTIRDLVDKCDDVSKYESSSNILKHIEHDYDRNYMKNFKNIPENYKAISGKEKFAKSLCQDVTNSNMYMLPDSHKNFNRFGMTGFVTASNKNIKLSDIALARCKKVFQGINLENQCNTDDKENVDNIIFEEHSKLNDDLTDKQNEINKTGVLPSIDDELILQEFQNSEMVRENLNERNESVQRKKLQVVENLQDNKKELHSNCIEICSGLPTNMNDFGMVNSKPVEMISKNETILNDLRLPGNDLNSIDVRDIIKEPIMPFEYSANTGPLNIFKTASNKPILISKEALLRTKNLFQDIHTPTYAQCKEPSQQEDIEIKGFKTANNKEIKVSYEAIDKSKKLFEDIVSGFTSNLKAVKIREDLSVNQNKIIEIELKDKYLPKNVGFKTANKKHIKISDEALHKSKRLLEDVSLEFTNDNTLNLKTTKIEQYFSENQNKIINIDLIDEHISKNVGFKTANNKEIKISHKALDNSKKLFEDIGIGITDDQNINSNNELVGQEFSINRKEITEIHIKDDHILQNVGFKTASNKSVTISKQALEKSAKLFQECHNEILHRTNSKCNDNNSENVNKPLFGGFKTASNKIVMTSSQALAKSKMIFQDFDLNTFSKSEENAFKTYSNEKLTILNETLAINTNEKFNKLNEINDEIGEIVSNKQNLEKLTEFDVIDKYKSSSGNHNSLPSFKGFHTASNKAVNVSEEALAKCRQIFQDEDLSSQVEKNIRVMNENGIFTTNDHLIESKNLNIKNNTLSNIEFKTASNRKIFISDNALHKSKNLLNEFDNETSRTSPKYVNVEIDKFEEKEILRNIIDTQILNNFDKTLYTEDFRNDVTTAKRSTSPILSCPKAKKRKFETPYKIYHAPIEIIKMADNETKNKFIFKDDYKKHKLYKLKDIQVMESKYIVTNINNYNTTFDGLLDFIFSNERNEITNTALHIEHLKEMFISAVNQKLVPDGWLDNHLKLIMWKLLSYESLYPNTLGVVCTARNVLNQLKYRYDKELYNVERPALRKILEKDDVPSKTLILCVVDIIKCALDEKSVTSLENRVEILVTDGWYYLKACLDKMLTEFVYKNKIIVGTKLVTNGAELLNCDQGVSPWEDTSSVRLKLFGNSTRRARWDSRLGYHGNVSMISRLSLVRPDGGKVSKLRVFVTRVYPMLFIEKFEDGNTVTRSERLEHLHETKYETDRQILLEKLYEEVEREFSDPESQDSEEMLNSSKRKMLDSGNKRISKIVKTSSEHFEFGNDLTESQSKFLQDRASKRRERLLRDVQTRLLEKMEKHGLCQKRNVVTLLKVRVADIEEKGDGVVVTKGMMSVWKPNEPVLELIKEGVWINIMNIVPTSVRCSELHMSAGRQSVFSKSKYKDDDKIKSHIQPLLRKCYHIKELIRKSSLKIDYKEIDTVGIIVSIEPTTQSFESIKNQFQNVFLADENKNMICVNFWGGLKKFGFEKVFDTGQIIACVNLQERVGNTKKNIPQYRVTEFTCFTKSPKNITIREMIEYLDKKIVLDRRKFCEDCVNLKNNVASLQNNEKVTPYRINNVNLVKNRMFINTPTGIKANVVDDLDLSGLDFESTFKQKETQELLSPKTLMRKRQVMEKINRLKVYGEPRPLSTIHFINKSVIKSYKSPLGGNLENSVATEKKYPDNSRPTVSPVTSMNRTYVKSGINPVKINFDNAETNISGVDHFAEEFDGSPPLSLE